MSKSKTRKGTPKRPVDKKEKKNPVRKPTDYDQKLRVTMQYGKYAYRAYQFGVWFHDHALPWIMSLMA